MATDVGMSPAGPVDLSNCAREPIHVPGFTQEFGVLLAMPAGEERISQISSNTDLIFGVAPTELVGQKISTVLGEANAAAIKEVCRLGTGKRQTPLRFR